MSDEATAPAETPPAPWYTDEIVESAAQAILEVHDLWGTAAEWYREAWRKDARAALDAIAPMVLDLLDEEYAKGYSNAYWNEDDKGVTE